MTGRQRENMVSRVQVGDSRHKKPPYREGARREMTERWKALVKSTIAQNKDRGVRPKNQSELARALGDLHHTEPPDRSAITKMFGQQSSGMVDDICVVLNIEPPMREADDEPEHEVVEIVRRLPLEKKRALLELITKTPQDKS